MSYKITFINGQVNSSELKKFICQDESDIAKLPRYGIDGIQEPESDTVSSKSCAIGSTAFVCSTSNTYVLAPNNTWIKINNTSSSGSSSGGVGGNLDIDNINPIASSSIQSLFS